MWIARETGWTMAEICGLTGPQLGQLTADMSDGGEGARLRLGEARYAAAAEAMKSDNRRKGLPEGLTPKQKTRLVEMMQDRK